MFNTLHEAWRDLSLGFIDKLRGDKSEVDDCGIATLELAKEMFYLGAHTAFTLEDASAAHDIESLALANMVQWRHECVEVIGDGAMKVHLKER